MSPWTGRLNSLYHGAMMALASSSVMATAPEVPPKKRQNAVPMEANHPVQRALDFRRTAPALNERTCLMEPPLVTMMIVIDDVASRLRLVDRLLGKGCLMQEIDRRHTRISWNVFQAEVGDEIVPGRVRMGPGNAAETRRQHVLHAKTGIGRQDGLLVVLDEFLIADAAVVARDAVLTAGHVGALVLRDRCRGVKRDRVPGGLGTALPHVVRQRKGATEVRAEDLEAPIRRATARKAPVMQEHRHG